ncbi:MAG: thioredoxin [Gemmatimonadetes bacterium]|nr:thioredoxin [Gemmatimonadota bacterium]
MTPTTDTPPATQHVTLRCQWCETWNRVDAARFADRPTCGSCKKPMLLDRPIKLDDATFARTIADSEIPVVVDFYADWCGPCRAMAPAVDEVAHELSGRVLVAKVDTDRSPVTSQAFRVTSIPTSIRFRGGREVQRVAGAMPLAALRTFCTAP